MAKSSSADRVRRNTSSRVREQLDAEAQSGVSEAAAASRGELDTRLEELEREWDIERYLEANASALGLTGLALGVGVDRRFLALPAVVMAFLLQHAVQGWCPPLPLFRRMGARTRQEIDREVYALKALRGDFEGMRLPARPVEEGRRAWAVANTDAAAVGTAGRGVAVAADAGYRRKGGR